MEGAPVFADPPNRHLRSRSVIAASLLVVLLLSIGNPLRGQEPRQVVSDPFGAIQLNLETSAERQLELAQEQGSVSRQGFRVDASDNWFGKTSHFTNTDRTVSA